MMAPAAGWIAGSVLAAALALGLAGCGDKEARAAQLEAHQQELASYQKRLAEQEKRLAEVEKRKNELDEENRESAVVLPESLERCPQPGHVSVVVGTPDVDHVVGAAPELVAVIGEIVAEVGRRAVRAQNDEVVQHFGGEFHVAAHQIVADGPLDPVAKWLFDECIPDVGKIVEERLGVGL